MAKNEKKEESARPEMITIAGETICRIFEGVTHGCKRQVWLLESPDGTPFAYFDSENELERWRVQFQKEQGQIATPLELRPSDSAPSRASADGNGSRRGTANTNRKTETNLPSMVTVAGKSIYRPLLGATRARTRRIWLLESLKGAPIACFDSEKELEQWWLRFQTIQGRRATRLEVHVADATPRDPTLSPQAGVKAVPGGPEDCSTGKSVGPTKKRTKRRRRGRHGGDQREKGYGGKQVSDYQKPWSSQYDMPEVDTHGFGRM